MFGANEIVGKKHFADLKVDELLVTSIFATLQGEGPYSGRKCVFVRLAKCNLACSFCDTYFDKGEAYSTHGLITKIIDVVHEWNAKNNGGNPVVEEGPQDILSNWGIVITGGEPLLQARSLSIFLHLARYTPKVQERGYSKTISYFAWQQIETNGILDCSYIPNDVTIVCSPKCVEKDGVPVKFIEPHPSILDRAACMKFVVTADQESRYSKLPEFALRWAKDTGKPLYISPMNMYLTEPKAALVAAKSNTELTIDERSEVLERISFWEEGLLDMEANRANHEYAALLCMRHGAILSLQTHLLASLP